MTAYATRAEFEGYVEGWTTDDPSALDRLLERASRDVDSVLGDYEIYTEGDWLGFKIDPEADLDAAQQQALSRATCAQAWYRFEMGEQHFVRPVLDSISGPEFQTTGMSPLIAPLAMRELAGHELLRNTISIRARGRRPSWAPIVRNLD